MDQETPYSYDKEEVFSWIMQKVYSVTTLVGIFFLVTPVTAQKLSHKLL
jgi:hypothetical protein